MGTWVRLLWIGFLLVGNLFVIIQVYQAGMDAIVIFDFGWLLLSSLLMAIFRNYPQYCLKSIAISFVMFVFFLYVFQKTDPLVLLASFGIVALIVFALLAFLLPWWTYSKELVKDWWEWFTIALPALSLFLTVVAVLLYALPDGYIPGDVAIPGIGSRLNLREWLIAWKGFYEWRIIFLLATALIISIAALIESLLEPRLLMRRFILPYLAWFDIDMSKGGILRHLYSISNIFVNFVFRIIANMLIGTFNYISEWVVRFSLWGYSFVRFSLAKLSKLLIIFLKSLRRLTFAFLLPVLICSILIAAIYLFSKSIHSFALTGEVNAIAITILFLPLFAAIYAWAIFPLKGMIQVALLPSYLILILLWPSSVIGMGMYWVIQRLLSHFGPVNNKVEIGKYTIISASVLIIWMLMLLVIELRRPTRKDS